MDDDDLPRRLVVGGGCRGCDGTIQFDRFVRADARSLTDRLQYSETVSVSWVRVAKSWVKDHVIGSKGLGNYCR